MLELDGNPLKFPGRDVVQKGRQAVLAFLRSAASRARPGAPGGAPLGASKESVPKEAIISTRASTDSLPAAA